MIRTNRNPLLSLLFNIVLLLFAVCCRAQSPIVTSNIPSAASMRVSVNLIAQSAVKRMGGKMVRIQTGMDALDVLKPPAFPLKSLSDVQAGLASNGLQAQWLAWGWPHNAGAIKGIPDASNIVIVRAMIQGTVDQIDSRDPNALIEITNEPDGISEASINGVPLWKSEGKTKGWISVRWFDGWWKVWQGVNWRGHKLCMSLVGCGGAAQKATEASWHCASGLAIRDMIARSGTTNAVHYNTYPNQTSTFTATPKAFTDRYIGVTWANTVAVHKRGILGGLGCCIGEVGVRQTSTLSGAKLWGLRQAIVNILVKLRIPFTEFAILTTDTNSGAGLGVCNLDGTPVYKDLNLAVPVMAGAALFLDVASAPLPNPAKHKKAA